MTKQAVIAVVVGVFIILSAGAAFLYSQTKPSNDAATTKITEQITEAPENNEARNTITEILAGEKNSMCKFAVAGETGSTNGTIYTSGENARGDFTTSADGEETVTHMIKDADTFYMWGDSLPMGIKMVMSVNELSSKLEGNDSFNSFNPDQEMDIDCVSWTPDATFFTPPSSVKFTSIDSMMPGSGATTVAPTKAATNPTSGASANECSICNSLSGQAKTTCLAQFNCN